MRTRSVSVAAALLLFGLAVAALAIEAPVAVSPGDSSKLALVEDRCPTFSWGVVSGARSYALVVYRFGGESEEARPVLRETLVGSASSWTPSLDRCLERGGQYAWNVRAVSSKETSDWSAPSLFEVTTGTTEEEFEQALEVVRQYTRTHGKAGAEAARGSETERPAQRRSLISKASASGRDRAAPVAAAPLSGLALSLDNNLQISKGDTPTLRLEQDGSGTFSAQTWDVRGNEVVFAVEDVTAGTTPFLIQPGAPSFSLKIRTDGVVETLVTPDPPCFNSTRRFVGCGNGTVTDTRTGLIWLKNAGCFGTQDYATANATAAALFDGSTNDPGGGDCGLTDGSRKGDWRLPKRQEFNAVIMATCSSGPRLVGNGAPATGCFVDSPWADGVDTTGQYWSSTSSLLSTFEAHAWPVLGSSASTGWDRLELHLIWPVRGHSDLLIGEF